MEEKNPQDCFCLEMQCTNIRGPVKTVMCERYKGGRKYPTTGRRGGCHMFPGHATISAVVSIRSSGLFLGTRPNRLRSGNLQLTDMEPNFPTIHILMRKNS